MYSDGDSSEDDFNAGLSFLEKIEADLEASPLTEQQ